MITPEKERARLADGRVEVIAEYQATYVRLFVRADSARMVRDCVAYLVGIQKIRIDDDTPNIVTSFETKFVDPIPLAWSHFGVSKRDIPSSMGCYVDLLKADSRSSRLGFAGSWPLVLRGFFDEPGTYRLGVLVAAGDGVSHVTQLDVVWNGKWDEIRAARV